MKKLNKIFMKQKFTKFEVFLFILLIISSFTPFFLTLFIKDLDFIFLMPFFLIPLLLVYYKLIKHQQFEIKNKKIKKQKQLQIEKLKELNSSNVGFYIHKIKNKFLPLQFSISELEDKIEPELKQEIDEQVNHVVEAIHEFDRIDELYRKQRFHLKEFDTFKTRYITLLKRKKIKFEVFYENISSETIVNIPYYSFYTIIELLFENSVKALETVENKKISIFFSQKENNLIIKFCDTGIGITKNNEKKIFQYGFSTKDGGTGIGLNQVQENLKALSGKINIGSQNEYNTVFELIIPNKINNYATFSTNN